KNDDPNVKIEIDMKRERNETCKVCNGIKTTKCPKCEGQKKVNCDKCGGSKSVTCSRCRGSGKEKTYEERARIVPRVKYYAVARDRTGSELWRREVSETEYKYGSMRSTGPSSGGGIGYNYTSYDVSYHDVETYYEEKEVTCGVCNGLGEVPCTNCDTMGKIKCDKCSGLGDITCSGCGGHGQQFVYSGIEKRYVTYEFGKEYSTFSEYPKEWIGNRLEGNLLKLTYEDLTSDKKEKDKTTEENEKLSSLLKKCVSEYEEWKKKNVGSLINRKDLSIFGYPITEVSVKRNDTNKYDESPKEFKIYALGSIKKWILDNTNVPFVRDETFVAEKSRQKHDYEDYITSSKKFLRLSIGLACVVWIFTMIFLLMQVLPRL
ncbi:MAG: hypothetical protein QXT63_03195, partial [Thermoplasmata archaeon]